MGPLGKSSLGTLESALLLLSILGGASCAPPPPTPPESSRIYASPLEPSADPLPIEMESIRDGAVPNPASQKTEKAPETNPTEVEPAPTTPSKTDPLDPAAPEERPTVDAPTLGPQSTTPAPQ